MFNFNSLMHSLLNTMAALTLKHNSFFFYSSKLPTCLNLECKLELIAEEIIQLKNHRTFLITGTTIASPTEVKKMKRKNVFIFIF